MRFLSSCLYAVAMRAAPALPACRVGAAAAGGAIPACRCSACVALRRAWGRATETASGVAALLAYGGQRGGAWRRLRRCGGGAARTALLPPCSCAAYYTCLLFSRLLCARARISLPFLPAFLTARCSSSGAAAVAWLSSLPAFCRILPARPLRACPASACVLPHLLPLPAAWRDLLDGRRRCACFLTWRDAASPAGRSRRQDAILRRAAGGGASAVRNENTSLSAAGKNRVSPCACRNF